MVSSCFRYLGFVRKAELTGAGVFQGIDGRDNDSAVADDFGADLFRQLFNRN